MRQIQKELGEGEEGAAEAAELKKAIDDAGMPEDVHKHAAKELKRLQRMGENSAESSMLRTYLEWLAELPWRDAELKPIDIGEARKVLDEDHYDLEKIKRRILEYLAVKKLNPNGKRDRKSTRLNSSHLVISYAVFCLKKKKMKYIS